MFAVAVFRGASGEPTALTWPIDFSVRPNGATACVCVGIGGGAVGDWNNEKTTKKARRHVVAAAAPTAFDRFPDRY